MFNRTGFGWTRQKRTPQNQKKSLKQPEKQLVRF